MIVFSNLWGKDTKKAESIKTFGLFSLSEEDYSLARASIFLLMSSITSSVSKLSAYFLYQKRITLWREPQSSC